MEYALGIDVGATNVKGAIVAPDGQVLCKHVLNTRDAWMNAVKQYLSETQRQSGPARWLGVACPGLVASDGQSIAWMQGRMADVQGLNWTEWLEQKRPVPVLNDAHAALVGEMWLGAGKGVKNAILLTLGTGVGGAVVCDGKLLTGGIGRAGHLGHISLNPNGPGDITGMPGSLEDAIGDCTIHNRSGGRFSSTVQLLDAAQHGDKEAKQVWEESVKALAAGIASIINCVDPELVILGGGIAQAGQMLMKPLDHWLNQFEWRPLGTRVPIVFAELGEFAGGIGAARNAMEHDAG